jgi:hypothetical protein
MAQPVLIILRLPELSSENHNIYLFQHSILDKFLGGSAGNLTIEKIFQTFPAAASSDIQADTPLDSSVIVAYLPE